MKLIACLIMLAFSHEIWARTGQDFNKELLKSVEKEIKKDDESFKRKSEIRRGPASVQENQIEEEKKLDKKDRQIGPKTW